METARSFDATSRQRLTHKTQAPATAGDEDDSTLFKSGQTPKDADEASAISTDIAIRKSGEPDAFAQMPAAAPSMTDEEAGLDDKPSGGGIVPLPWKGAPS